MRFYDPVLSIRPRKVRKKSRKMPFFEFHYISTCAIYVYVRVNGSSGKYSYYVLVTRQYVRNIKLKKIEDEEELIAGALLYFHRLTS